MAKSGKHAKALKRREKIARDARRREAVKAVREYPKIVMVPNEAPPSFVAAVREAAKTIDFRNREEFPEWEAEHYRDIKAQGIANARLRIRMTPEQEADPSFDRKAYLDKCTTHFAYNLGERVFQRIPTEMLLAHVPYNDAFFIPTGNEIHAVFRSLKRAKGPHGTVYFSRHRPKTLIDGREFTVAFSDHALQRMCERLAPVWPSYTQLGEIFAFIDQCQEYQPTRNGDDPAITLFNNCYPGSWQDGVAKAVFGEEYEPSADYCVRLGYFPVVIEGEFAKAVTLLYPGFKNTPEHKAIHAARLEWSLKRQLLEVAERLDARAVLDPEVAKILKWFQDNGIEQVQKRKVKYKESIE